MKTYPEINAMNDVRIIELAIRLGVLNIDNVKPEHRADLNSRIKALHERRRRLLATAKMGGR